MADRKLSRRDLFRVFGRRVEKVANRTVAVARPAGGLAFLRPPGFTGKGTEACRDCVACLEACPRESIFPMKRGASPDHTPLIDPTKAPCVLCDDLPCIQACPSGVLAPVPREEVRMAVAEIIEDRCRHAEGKACLDCFRACPLPQIAMRVEKVEYGLKPGVIPDGCTGCGNCLYSCPERPRAMRMVPVLATPRRPTPGSSG
ncbi:MAG: 4Fe-4S dicluster domain-containing protein [Deltaproteobacteria bacterium]|nr:4Fe-4S dicluster domain-containing protein [Deltaproteobacteria bacterium]